MMMLKLLPTYSMIIDYGRRVASRTKQRRFIFCEFYQIFVGEKVETKLKAGPFFQQKKS